ncbi:MAG: hypothetical protein ABI553_10165 [Chloroflexota bacterium]
MVLGIAVVLALAAIRLLDQPLALESYRVLDPQTLVVIGYGSPRAWTHITGVTETDQTVTIAVNAFTFELGPGTSSAARLYVPIYLSEALGSRAVMDGTTGQPIPGSG